MNTLRIALIGDHDPSVTAHRAVPLALERASGVLGRAIEPVWVGTETIGADAAGRLAGFAGVWCVPATPYRNTAGALAAIRRARETGTPFLGTCGGFQHAVLEYARNVLGLSGADHAELDPDSSFPLIAPLTCSLVEQRGTVSFREGSKLSAIYGRGEAVEGYHCNYGLNPEFESLLSSGPLKITCRDLSGDARGVELDGHPFYIGTLFQPERGALSGVTPPLALALARAATRHETAV